MSIETPPGPPEATTAPAPRYPNADVPAQAAGDLRARYASDEDYLDAQRVVKAGAWTVVLTLLLTPFAVPAIILGAIAVHKRRVLAGTVIMCLATLAVVASFFIYSAAVLSAFEDDGGVGTLFEDDPSNTGTEESTPNSGLSGQHDSVEDCMVDPNTTYADCDREFPGELE